MRTTTLTPDDIRDRRRVLGMTQAQLAAALGVTTNTVSRWEQGWHRPPPMARRLLDQLVKERSPT